MKIAVLANGAWEKKWGSRVLQEVDFLICADGGANHAFLCGRLPDLLVGDLDSVSEDVLRWCEESGCEIVGFPREKDQTDLELALGLAEKRAVQAGEREILLYGGTGRRPDHFLANLALLLAYARKGYRVRMADPVQELWVLKGRERIRGSAGQTLSLLPMSEQAVVTTEGLYYPLNREVLYQDSPRGVSNVFLREEVVVQVWEGWVLVVLLA